MYVVELLSGRQEMSSCSFNRQHFFCPISSAPALHSGTVCTLYDGIPLKKNGLKLLQTDEIFPCRNRVQNKSARFPARSHQGTCCPQHPHSSIFSNMELFILAQTSVDEYFVCWILAMTSSFKPFVCSGREIQKSFPF